MDDTLITEAAAPATLDGAVLEDVVGETEGSAPVTAALSTRRISRETSSIVIGELRLRAGVSQMQGRRREMEDAHQIADCSQEMVPTVTPEQFSELSSGGSILAVFDGHAGSGAAEYAGKNLHKYFMGHEEFKTNPRRALEETFAKIETEICENYSQSGDGTTAVVAYIYGGKLLVGHVGDSEAVLCRGGTAIPLTEPHNAKASERERQRIRDAGGLLVAGDTRVGHPALNPNLFSIAVTRALGDVLLKSDEYTKGRPSGLIAIPEICELDLTDEDEFIVLACDGVWDVLNHQQVSDVVKEQLAQFKDPQQASQALIDLAYNKGSNDNITAVVCSFRH